MQNADNVPLGGRIRFLHSEFCILNYAQGSHRTVPSVFTNSRSAIILTDFIRGESPDETTHVVEDCCHSAAHWNRDRIARRAATGRTGWTTALFRREPARPADQPGTRWRVQPDV